MTVTTLLFLAIAALCIGFSKAGFSGISLISVFILADTFGARESLGIALPLLIIADIIVYPAFRKHGSWSQVWKIFPPAIMGIAIGYFLLSDLSDDIMRKVIGYIILGMAVLQVVKAIYQQRIEIIAKSRTFAVISASFGGIATVLANAAGPIYQLYFLSIKLPKMELIGVCARFFLVINILKIPLSTSLDLITKDTLLINLGMIPLVAIGIFGGKKLITKIPQKAFEHLVILFAIIAGIRLAIF